MVTMDANKRAPDRPSPGSSGAERTRADADAREVVFETRELTVYYGEFRAVRDVNLDVRKNEITAFIGPSGCGKSTVLRCFDRMNDLIDGARGRQLYHGVDLYGPTSTRSRCAAAIGMVFQKPNPFPKTIYDNVAFGPRINGVKKKTSSTTSSRSLRRASAVGGGEGSSEDLGDGSLRRPAAAPLHRPSVAVEPDVILMDEPCSALDPIATARIEDLMQEMKKEFTIVIVTHNMQQAAASATARRSSPPRSHRSDRRTGVLVEFDPNEKIFSNPRHTDRDYVTGRFG